MISRMLEVPSVFVSQNSGISSKPNYHIDYFNGNMIIYIQNTDYSSERIKIAIDIIDNLSSKLQDFNKQNDENSIPTSVLNDINKEYQLFISQKEALIGVYKDCQKNYRTAKLINCVNITKLILNFLENNSRIIFVS